VSPLHWPPPERWKIKEEKRSTRTRNLSRAQSPPSASHTPTLWPWEAISHGATSSTRASSSSTPDTWTIPSAPWCQSSFLLRRICVTRQVGKSSTHVYLIRPNLLPHPKTRNTSIHPISIKAITSYCLSSPFSFSRLLI